MDPHNDKEIFSQEAVNYWRQVDLYIGGIEHATGHLLYSRFWQKFMYDKGLVPVDEYAKKLINQGMILGNSAFVYRWEYGKGDAFEQKGKIIFVSQGLIEDAVKKKSFIEESTEEFRELFEKLVKFHGRINTSAANWANFCPIHVDVAIINSSDELDIEAFKNSRPEYKDAEFILENGKYFVGRDIEKMSKSKYNVVSPDTICEEYGADSLRMYEMFLGPLEQAKPWNTAGITGVHSFLKKLWRLYHSGPNGRFYVAEDSNGAEGRGEIFKTLHKTIKKVEEDIENFSFNTSVSTFMICVNELSAQKCTSRDILEPLAVLISPYAPHIAEELWEKLGNEGSVSTASFPKFEPKYLVEDSKEYPISFNGKMRFTIELPLDMSKDDIEAAVMAHERTQKQLQGRTPKKVIVVPGKIVNIVG
jgi:leucyl-tRNA synthetase